MNTQQDTIETDDPAIQAQASCIAPPGQYLTFILGGEAFAIGILHIKEIIEYGDITEVPMMPKFIRGVINLRGRVVPVVDLAARFGRGSTTIAKRTGIVIVETSGSSDAEGDAKQQDIGIIVDAVNEVVDIGSKDIEPAPAFGARIRPEFINGMAKQNGHFIILLNVDSVLSVDEMAQVSKTMGKDYQQNSEQYE